MTMKDKLVLIEGLKKLSADVADLATLLEGVEAPEKEQGQPAENVTSTPKEEAPIKLYTYEEVRAVLAEKARKGFRPEVKALLTAHGVKQLSEITDPDIFAVIITEAEGIGNG